MLLNFCKLCSFLEETALKINRILLHKTAQKSQFNTYPAEPGFVLFRKNTVDQDQLASVNRSRSL